MDNDDLDILDLDDDILHRIGEAISERDAEQVFLEDQEEYLLQKLDALGLI